MGQLLRGRETGKGYELPGDILGGQHGTVGGEHSHAITGGVNAGSYVVVVLCLRLQLFVSLYSADGWLEERPHLPGGEKRTIPHLVWGLVPRICSCCSAVQDVARPRHRFSPQRRVGRCTRVHYGRLDARGKGSVVDKNGNDRMATPLYLRLSAGVNSCLISPLRHIFPNFPPKHSPPFSDLTAITADGVPSARTSARKDSNALAASDFLPRKYTRVNRVQSSRTMSLNHFPPILGTAIFPLRSTNTQL